MHATGLSVFQHINNTFWSLMCERPDLYVCVTDDMVSWLGFGGDSKHQKQMIRTLDTLSISYKYLNIEELKKAADQVLKIPIDADVRSLNYKHLLMKPLEFQLCSAMVKTQKGKEVATVLVKLRFVVHCYRQYELEVKE